MRWLSILLLALPLAAQTHNNVDDLGLGTPGWQPACVGPTCAGGVTPPTSWNQTFVNASPSLDGNSMMMTETGTDYANVMFHYAFGANNSATTFTGTYHVYIQTSLAPWQVFGMDMYQYLPGNVRLMFGSQCAIAGSTAGFWSFFDQGDNSPTGTWKVSTVPCPIVAPNTWYTISMTVHRVAGDTSCAGGVPAEHYDSITQGSTTYPLNLTYCSESAAYSPDTGMQFDVSSGAAGGTLTAYVDEMSYTASTNSTAPASSCTPAGGTFISPQTVTCTNTAPVQCYNFTGSPATNGTTGCTTGTLYTGPIATGNATLYISGGGTGYTNGPITPYTFTITPARVPGGRVNAVQAPDPAGTNYAAYTAVLAQKNPLLTGQTLLVGLGNTASSVLYLDSESGAGVCSPSNTAGFALLDGIISSYVTNVLLAPATEGGVNINTPACVFSQAQANAAALTRTASATYLPGWYVCVGGSCPSSGTYWQIQAGTYAGSGYANTCTASSGSVSLTGAGPVTDGTCSWVNVGTSAPTQDGFCGPSYLCGTSAGPSCYATSGTTTINVTNYAARGCTLAELYQSEPIPSELPIVNYYEQMISAFVTHYNSNPNMGYARLGSPAGGELSPVGIGTTTPANGVWPFYGSSAGQKRATYLSWVAVLDAYIVSLTPAFPIFTDLNCPGGDCTYADQEAQLAHDQCFNGEGTNGYQVEDILNLLGTGTGSCNLTTGLVASSTCGTGDWPYNFLRFPTNACGGHMYHSLQTLTGSTPLYCNAAPTGCPGITGPLGPLPVTSNCTAGFSGLLPFLGTLANVGIGALNQKIVVDNLELYVNAPTSNPNGVVSASCASPVGTIAWPASDMLLGLYSNYAGTTGARTQYLAAPAGCTPPAAGCNLPALNYAGALAQYLGIGTTTGGTAPTGLTVFSSEVLCGPPAYCSRTDLLAVNLPLVAPQMGPNVCSPSSPTSCGNLTGAGTCAADPNFGNLVCRLSDATLDPSKPNLTHNATASGSGDENLFSCDSSKIVINNSGARYYPMNFFGTSAATTRMYTTNATWTASGGFYFGATAPEPMQAITWGRVCPTDANVLWGLGGTDGATLGHFDFTGQCSSCTPPAFVPDFDFIEANCLDSTIGWSGSVTWQSNGDNSQDDNDFAYVFSNNGSQGGVGAIFVVVWRRGQGCRVLNTSTGMINGDWGPTGAIVGSKCALPPIHNMKILKSGGSTGSLEVDYASNACGGPIPNAVYNWQYTGLNYGPQATTEGSGHWTEGVNHWCNNTGNALPNFYDCRLNTAPGSPFGVVPALPSGGIDASFDQHPGWNVLNDLWPFSTSTHIPGAIKKAWSNEIMAIDPTGVSNPWRFANSYITANNSDFSTNWAIGSQSQDGKWYMFSSDWLGTLGSTTGTAACTLPTNCRGDVFVVGLH